MIVLDSTVLVDVLRGHPETNRAIGEVSARRERLLCSVMSRFEVLAGMRTHEGDAVQKFFGTLEWIPVDNEIAELAGALANQFLRAFPGVDTSDYIIAATAMRYNATLWTRNVKHFPMFSNLTAPY